RKQRHTARRIYQRLREEHGYEGAESTIRRVVAQLRRELEMDVLEPFFVLSSDPGEMAQVDWGQAKVMLAGVPTVVHLFCLRLHYSGVAFVWASLHEKLEAFLEGHVQAFAWLCQGRNEMPQNRRSKVPQKRRFEKSPASVVLLHRG